MVRFDPRAILRSYTAHAGASPSVELTLGPLTFLVGPNGSGKSNFLDALRFVADALNTTLEQSLRDRGGIQSVRRRPEDTRPTSASGST